MHLHLFSVAALAAHLSTASAISYGHSPTATTKNGTYQGRYLEEWDQDVFLGIPFAQPPVGSLRYRWPQSLNSSFDGTRDATSYGFSCMQYGTSFNLSEDCLTLNVIRPAGSAKAKLPVLVWIYGGGLGVGTSADAQYNMSGIIKTSQDLDMPTLGVSINYRVNHWGFFQNPQVLSEGSSNAGLLDQRMALRWIQENIDSFGGDASRITIWGESAGAQSIAYQMFSYDGRDDKLFRAAIMESGGPMGAPLKDLGYWGPPFDNLTSAVGCQPAEDQLACLRTVLQAELFSQQQREAWRSPLIDGDFLTDYPSQLMPQGKYIKVPLLIGANTDEGNNFNPAVSSSVHLVDDQALINSFLGYRDLDLSPATVKHLLRLYPLQNDTALSLQELEELRAKDMGGDMVMIATRRRMCELMSSNPANQPVFSYRFDQRLWNRTVEQGVQHFDNVAFSFQNISGLLGPSPEYDSHRRLSRAVGEAYIRFVNHLDPNPSDGQNGLLPHWPEYSLQEPTNMVLNASRSYVEADTFRKEGIAFMNQPYVSRELLG